MASIEPLLIICADPKIHKPKPKRIIKKSYIYQYNKKSNHYNRYSNPRTSRMNNHDQKKKNYEKNEKLCFNLDLISLEEIENDFKEFKSKSEEIEVQRELINLIRRAPDETCRNDSYRNFQRIKRPQKPFCTNIE